MSNNSMWPNPGSEEESSDTDWSSEASSEDPGPTYPSVDAHEFVALYLPRVPEAADAMDDIIKWVKTESGEYENGRWKMFTMDPADYRQPDARVFTKLCGIVNTIHNAVGKCLPELHSKLQTRFYTWTSSLTDVTRPGSCFVLDNERSRGKDNPDWFDMAVTGECKMDDTTGVRRDNAAQILWNMRYVFRKDPRRNRAFGYTIENRTFSMWSVSRSGIIRSNPVDFITDPEYIIRFFFAFMYASPAEMGWDPTMKMIWDGDKLVQPQYDITVRSKEGLVKVFRTDSIISAISAESVHGRGTRVWKVRELLEGAPSGEYHVLKDTWIDPDRMSEDEVIAQILQDARATLNEEEMEVITGSLLTTVIAGPVVLLDDARTPACKTKVPAPPGGKASAGPNGSARIRYRIVFEEVCEDLHSIKSLQIVLWALRQASIGLYCLHKLGWVHRDLSSGNLMVGRGQLKIADFEYAKKMTEPRGEVGDICTGTEDFMAVEVHHQQYRFFTSTPGVEDDTLAETKVGEYFKPLASTKGYTAMKRTKLFVSPTWFYNPIHDLESIFWLTLYFLINRDFRCIPNTPSKVREAYAFEEESYEQRRSRIIGHWNFGRSLFASRSGRDDVIRVNELLADFLIKHPLHPALNPLDGILEYMRASLLTAYYEIERDASNITHLSAHWLSDRFAELLHSAAGHVGSTDHLVEIRSLRTALDAVLIADEERNEALLKMPPPSTSATKRRREMEDDDEHAGSATARKSKSPRISLGHTSPETPSKGKKRTTGKARYIPRRPVLPICAPFIDSASSDDIPAPPPPQPPTRVLRSRARDTVEPVPIPLAPLATTRATRTRKLTAAGQRAREVAKVKETPKTATTRKVSTKTLQSKPRARKNRGS